MSASSLDALQRLQKRQRSDVAYPTSPLASRVSVDPMHVEFMPTVVDSVSVSDTTSTSSLGKHTPTRSTSTMTGSGHPRYLPLFVLFCFDLKQTKYFPLETDDNPNTTFYSLLFVEIQ